MIEGHAGFLLAVSLSKPTSVSAKNKNGLRRIKCSQHWSLKYILRDTLNVVIKPLLLLIRISERPKVWSILPARSVSVCHFTRQLSTSGYVQAFCISKWAWMTFQSPLWMHNILSSSTKRLKFSSKSACFICSPSLRSLSSTECYLPFSVKFQHCYLRAKKLSTVSKPRT